jgi:hypothetical protein
MCDRIVPEFRDQRVAIERGLYDAALDAAAAPMNKTHFAQSRSGGGIDVVPDDGWDVSRREGVEIELALNRDENWILSHQP